MPANEAPNCLMSLACASRGAARGDQVVHDQHHVFGIDGVGVDLQLVASVLQVIAFAANLARQLARACVRARSRHADDTQPAHRS